MAASDHLGPQFHGTNAALKPGDFINPGHRESQYNYADEAHHVFSAGSPHQAGDYARFAKALAGMGEIPGPEEAHVYQVEHTGPTEPVPNPTNPDVIYHRGKAPLRVVSELPASHWSY